MLALNNDKTHLIFSVGKTGSSSVQKVLDSSWLTVGESNINYREWIQPCHPDDVNRKMQQYEALDEITFVYNPKVTCIIREPWKRFVSGIKEILQDYCYLLYKDHNQFEENWNRMMNDPEVLAEVLSRVFYITEFDTDEYYRKHTFNWHRSFSIFHNYHTKNWLHKVKQISNPNIVSINELDNFIISLGHTPTRENVSNKRDIDTIDIALKNCNVYHIIQDYLIPEIELYESFS